MAGMKTKLTPILIAIAGGILIGSITSTSTPNAAAQSSANPWVGRYQVGFRGTNAIKIDTATGTTWELMITKFPSENVAPNIIVKGWTPLEDDYLQALKNAEVAYSQIRTRHSK